MQVECEISGQQLPETVAEGVEPPGQLVQLRALGARMGQGLYFARPMDGRAFVEHVRVEERAAG